MCVPSISIRLMQLLGGTTLLQPSRHQSHLSSTDRCWRMAGYRDEPTASSAVVIGLAAEVIPAQLSLACGRNDNQGILEDCLQLGRNLFEG